MLIELVQFTPYTWIGILSISVIFYFFMLIFQDDYIALACIFLAMGYLDLIMLYTIKRTNTDILTKLVNPKLLKLENEADGNEQPSIGSAGGEADFNALDDLRRASKTSNKDSTKSSKRYQSNSDDEDDEGDKAPLQNRRSRADSESRGETLTGIMHRDSRLFHLHIHEADKPLFICGASDPSTISWVSYYFYGNRAVPNRQHKLFTFDLMGPAMNVYF